MRVREPDEVCAQAVDLARDAAASVSRAAAVGEHVGVEADADRVVTHLFICLDPAYRGWRWAVTLARASRAKNVTVSESVLVPGPDAILAPDWVPWRERLLPGDLGVGDLLPASADDERLVPALPLDGEEGIGLWLAQVADLSASVEQPGAESGQAAELLPVQARVLSMIGRDDAAVRWHGGHQGPDSPLAGAAPAPCSGCGFFIRLSWPLGQAFGVCANAYAPDDGRVVSVDHGCGAHSEAMSVSGSELSALVTDEFRYDLIDLPGVSVEETDFEPLDGA